MHDTPHSITLLARQHYAPPLPLGLNHFLEFVQVVLVAQDVLDGGETVDGALFLLGNINEDYPVVSMFCQPLHGQSSFMPRHS